MLLLGVVNGDADVQYRRTVAAKIDAGFEGDLQTLAAWISNNPQVRRADPPQLSPQGEDQPHLDVILEDCSQQLVKALDLRH